MGEEAGYFPPCHCCPAWCCCCTPPPEEEDKGESEGENTAGEAPLKAKEAAAGGAAAVEESEKLLKKAGAAVDEESKALLDGEEGKAAAAAGGGANVSEPTPVDTEQRIKKFRRKSSIGSLFSAPSRKGTLRGSMGGDEEEGSGAERGAKKGDKDMDAVLSEEALDQIESVDQDNCCVQFLKNYFFCCFSPLTMEVRCAGTRLEA